MKHFYPADALLNRLVVDALLTRFVVTVQARTDRVSVTLMISTSRLVSSQVRTDLDPALAREAEQVLRAQIAATPKASGERRMQLKEEWKTVANR